MQTKCADMTGKPATGCILQLLFSLSINMSASIIPISGSLNSLTGCHLEFISKVDSHPDVAHILTKC